ncbi:MAG TPA: WXG100 family type VII secretion target [Nocardioides sp.]|uniref:WXG100 family type VII secretion target n=1 Tax=Nocardioides sp. TaxID=35761 RepID=UPI002E357D3C|nr:WXG100 family type VII secretion target [Nocardioides sp.]HEX5086954.1 WXG100 family type VII secretion target [Nocardioides sp.]
MSSFSYAVDLPLARDVLASLAAVGADLDEVVADLRWRVARLHSLWAGTAAAAHLEAHASWEASCREMHAALGAMRAAVRTAAANYDDASSTNAAMWSQVR